MDLNIYINFLSRYNVLTEEATTLGGMPLEQLCADLKWDDDMISYCRYKRLYLGALPSTDA